MRCQVDLRSLPDRPSFPALAAWLPAEKDAPDSPGSPGSPGDVAASARWHSAGPGVDRGLGVVPGIDRGVDLSDQQGSADAGAGAGGAGRTSVGRTSVGRISVGVGGEASLLGVGGGSMGGFGRPSGARPERAGHRTDPADVAAYARAAALYQRSSQVRPQKTLRIQTLKLAPTTPRATIKSFNIRIYALPTLNMPQLLPRLGFARS